MPSNVEVDADYLASLKDKAGLSDRTKAVKAR